MEGVDATQVLQRVRSGITRRPDGRGESHNFKWWFKSAQGKTANEIFIYLFVFLSSERNILQSPVFPIGF